MKIRYIGSGTNPASYQEYPVTGVNALWQPEQVSDVSDARANALVATGGFVFFGDQAAYSDTAKSTFALHSRALPQSERVSRSSVVPVKKWGRLENTSASANTWHQTHDLPFSFDAYKVRVHNVNTVTIASYRIAVAMTDAAVDGASSIITPSGAWTDTLFSGANTVTVPAATSGGGTSDAVPGTIESDLMVHSSIAKASGQAGAFVMIRGYWPAGNGSRVSMTQTPTLATAKFFQAFNGGDCITTPGSFSSTTAQAIGQGIELLCYTRDNIRKVMLCGDSTFQGLDDTDQAIGWGHRVCNALGSADRPVVFVNNGFASQSSGAYLTNAINALSYYGADVAVFCPFSANDSDKYTAAGESRQLYNISRFIDAAKVAGVTPVLATPFPVGGLNSTQEASRRKIALAVRNMSSRIPVIDFDIAFTNYGSTSGGWAVAAYTSGTVHPSALGHAYAAEIAKPIISAATQ